MMLSTGEKPHGASPLPDETMVRLRGALGRDLRRTALERFGLSFKAVTRCLAGLPVHSGTAAMIDKVLQR